MKNIILQTTTYNKGFRFNTLGKSLFFSNSLEYQKYIKKYSLFKINNTRDKRWF